MTPADVETVYEALALRLDRIAPGRREIFLAKLALLLARDIGDPAPVLARIEDAAADLDT